MALHFELKVNKDGIGWFVAQRRELVIPEDGICTYDVDIDQYYFEMKHNYHDGAWVLVRKAIEQMEKEPRYEP